MSEIRLLFFNVTVALLLVLVTIPVRYVTGLGGWTNLLWFIPLGWWLWYRGAVSGNLSRGMLIIVCAFDFHSLLWQTFWPQAGELAYWFDIGLIVSLFVLLRRRMLEPDDSGGENAGQIMSRG